MRILVVHPHLHFLGGSEVLTKILVYGLADLGHEVVVLSRSFREDLFRPAKRVALEEFRVVDEGDTVEARLVNILHTFTEVFRKYGELLPFIMIQEPIYAALLKAVKPGAGVGMYIHFPREEELTPENRRRFLQNYRFPNMYDCFYRVADLHLTNSNYTARALYKFYGIPSNVVYPAIPREYFEAGEEFEARDREPRIISVARFVPQKRLDLLIQWFRDRVRREVPDAQLLIVGIPDRRYVDHYKRIKELASSTEGVELIDRPMKPAELAKHYRRSKVYVHLRIGEHFGMAPVEAMTQATIPVVPRRSGLAELIINGHNGYAYETDEEALNTIIKILKMGGEEYVRIAKNSWRTSWNFTPMNFASAIANYLKLLT